MASWTLFRGQQSGCNRFSKLSPLHNTKTQDLVSQHIHQTKHKLQLPVPTKTSSTDENPSSGAKKYTVVLSSQPSSATSDEKTIIHHKPVPHLHCTHTPTHSNMKYNPFEATSDQTSPSSSDNPSITIPFAFGTPMRILPRGTRTSRTFMHPKTFTSLSFGQLRKAHPTI